MQVQHFHAAKERIHSIISSGSMRMLSFSILFMLFLVLPVAADIIFPVHTYGFKISNLEDYPEYYVIMIYPDTGGGGYGMVSRGKYNDISEDKVPGVFAVRKTDFDPSLAGTALSLRGIPSL